MFFLLLGSNGLIKEKIWMKVQSNSNAKVRDFDFLTPDVAVTAAEAATGKKFTGFAAVLPSYINRVYELEACDRSRFVIKFYRPGRWSRQAIIEEHTFMARCVERELPIIAPCLLPNGRTWATACGVAFALYPKMRGRQLELNQLTDWRRLGRLIGRLHECGDSLGKVEDRLCWNPWEATQPALERLLEEGVILSAALEKSFYTVAAELLDELCRIFSTIPLTMRPIHGDCHGGNILMRPDCGLTLIDFDDMMVGPAVQDFWLLLPDYPGNCQAELSEFLTGYEEFCNFSYSELQLIEPLRAMRMVYYLDWCARQRDDFQFRHLYPEWGSDCFWRHEITDLQEQLERIQKVAGNSF